MITSGEQSNPTGAAGAHSGWSGALTGRQLLRNTWYCGRCSLLLESETNLHQGTVDLSEGDEGLQREQLQLRFRLREVLFCGRTSFEIQREQSRR